MKKKLWHNSIPSLLYRYLIVGGVTAVVDMSFLAILFYGFQLQRQVSVTIAYVFGVMVHFTLNRNFTFRASNVFIIRQIGRYLIILIISYLLTVSVIEIGVNLFTLPILFVKAAAIVITFWVGYVLNRLWVFRVVEQQKPLQL